MSERVPLALCPGLLLDERMWQHAIPALSDLADCRVADFTTQDSGREMAESVLAMMPPGRFALCGLSMGGYVALEMMRLAPERVERLALLDTRARLDSPEESARRRGLIELARKGRFKGVTPKLLPLLLHPKNLADERLTALVMAMAERIGRDGFLRQQKAIMTRSDFLPLLPSIAVPTLVLCGRQDSLTPLAFHEEMAAAIPGARLVVVEESGHLPPLERPAATHGALREWLLAPAGR